MIALLWQWRKAIALGAVVIVLSLVGLRVSAWRTAYKALPAVQAALEAEQACGEGSECQKRQAALQAAAEAKSAEVVSEYQREIEELRNRPVPHRVIRVCNDRGVQSPGAAGRTDAGASGEGLVQRGDELDTRPLRELARRADEVTAQCRQLIRWNEALAAD